MVAGTLALYSTSIDDIANEDNQVVAKQFILTGEGVGDFNTTVKIAPEETVGKVFTIQNYTETITTETNMFVNVTVKVAPTPGKTGIPYLQVVVRDERNAMVGFGETDETGSLILNWNDTFYANTKEQRTYTIAVAWLSNADDINNINQSSWYTKSCVNLNSS